MAIFDYAIFRKLNSCGGSDTGGSGGSGGEEWIGDGNTHLWISLPEGRTSPMLGIHVQGTVTVDWGDGTTPDVLTGTLMWQVQWTPTHNYAKAGNYVITLTVDGAMRFGDGTDNYCKLLRYDTTTISANYRNQSYVNCIKKIEVGTNVARLSMYSFINCQSLSKINVSSGVAIDKCAFKNCVSLNSIVIPNDCTYIGESAFEGCHAMASVVIPPSVDTIVNYAFYNCQGVEYFDFSRHATVPTLSTTMGFYRISSYTQIRVPAALYDEWIAATNWTTYASNIVAV